MVTSLSVIYQRVAVQLVLTSITIVLLLLSQPDKHKLRRILKHGGRLFLTLDNLQNPVVRLRNCLPFHWLHRLGIVPYFVGKTLTPAQLYRALERAGFKIERTEAGMHIPRMPAVLLAKMAEKINSTHIRQALLTTMMSMEALSRLPIRYLTGYYIMVRAVKSEQRQG